MPRTLTETSLPRFLSHVTMRELYEKAGERGLFREHALVSYTGAGRYSKIVAGQKRDGYRLLVIDIPLTRGGMVRRCSIGVSEEDMPWLRTRLREVPEGAFGPVDNPAPIEPYLRR